LHHVRQRRSWLGGATVLKQLRPEAQSPESTQLWPWAPLPVRVHNVNHGCGGAVAWARSHFMPATGQPELVMGLQLSEHMVTGSAPPEPVNVIAHSPAGGEQSVSRSQNLWQVPGGPPICTHR